MSIDRMRMHFRVCMSSALDAARSVHNAACIGGTQPHLTTAMHNLLIVAEECRQALAMPPPQTGEGGENDC